MSLLEEEGEHSEEEAFKATTALREMRAESTEFYDAPMTTDQNEKKEKKEKEKRKVLMANDSSSSYQHQQEKHKATALEPRVATGDEDVRRTTIPLRNSPTRRRLMQPEM